MTPDNEPNSAHGYTEGSEGNPGIVAKHLVEGIPKDGPDEFVKGEKKHPDFNEWMKTKEGENCMKWPISEPKYLHNRLFWAFDAGRNCVWDQYLEYKEENARLRKLIEKAFITDAVEETWEQFKKDNGL